MALQEQFPLLRALWPGPLLTRWNLNRLHGPYDHEGADKRYGEFDILMDPDRDTRQALAGVIRGTTGAGEAAFVTGEGQAAGLPAGCHRRIPIGSHPRGAEGCDGTGAGGAGAAG